MTNRCPRCNSPGLYREYNEIACLYCGERIYPGVQAINDLKPERADKGTRRKEYRRHKKHTEKPQTYWVA